MKTVDTIGLSLFFAIIGAITGACLGAICGPILLYVFYLVLSPLALNDGQWGLGLLAAVAAGAILFGLMGAVGAVILTIRSDNHNQAGNSKGHE